MTAAALSRPAGTARLLLSGGWLVDVGDAYPTWVPSREAALDLLDPTDVPAESSPVGSAGAQTMQHLAGAPVTGAAGAPARART